MSPLYELIDGLIAISPSLYGAYAYQGECAGRDLGYRGAFAQSPISARRRRKFFLRSESCGNFDWKSMKIDDFKPLWLRKWRTQRNINQLEWDLLSDLWSKKLDVETFLCQSRKKISFSKINLLNLRKNLVGPWGSTQLGERSPKPVSPPKSDTRKVSPPSSPQNRPTCTCSTLPRASARQPPLAAATRGSVWWKQRYFDENFES